MASKSTGNPEPLRNLQMFAKQISGDLRFQRPETKHRPSQPLKQREAPSEQGGATGVQKRRKQFHHFFLVTGGEPVHVVDHEHGGGLLFGHALRHRGRFAWCGTFVAVPRSKDGFRIREFVHVRSSHPTFCCEESLGVGIQQHRLANTGQAANNQSSFLFKPFMNVLEGAGSPDQEGGLR